MVFLFLLFDCFSSSSSSSSHLFISTRLRFAPCFFVAVLTLPFVSLRYNVVLFRFSRFCLWVWMASLERYLVLSCHCLRYLYIYYILNSSSPCRNLRIHPCPFSFCCAPFFRRLCLAVAGDADAVCCPYPYTISQILICSAVRREVNKTFLYRSFPISFSLFCFFFFIILFIFFLYGFGSRCHFVHVSVCVCVAIPCVVPSSHPTMLKATCVILLDTHFWS